MNIFSFTIRTLLAVAGWFNYQFIIKKLNTVFGYFFFAVIGIAMAYATAVIDFKIGLIIAGAFIGILTVILCVRYPHFGLYFTMSLAGLLAAIGRLANLSFNFPFGIIIEVYTYLTLFGILIKHDLRRNMNGEFWTNPITIVTLLLLGYHFMEMFNPAMFSKTGWSNFYRKQISFFFFYYITYCLLASRRSIDYFVNFLVVSISLMAFYACKQQWFGYGDFEMRSILSAGPRAYQLLFQGGFLRKFSTMSDPATSGVLFAAAFMLCVILLLREDGRKRRWWLGIAAVLNLLGYSYSGTRTATFMVVTGIVFYVAATIYEKKTFIFLACALFAFAFLMFAPIHSPVIERTRTTFEGTKDPSAAIRDYDRHEVQPYIQDHPMGGGIYTSGMEGPVYNKGHYLMMFQPDSGYMKTLAEQGAIGFALMLIYYFFVMRIGIRNFYRSKDPKIQNQYIALLTMTFTLMTAQYAQISMNQYPICLIFIGIMVVFIKSAKYENAAVVESTNP